MLYFKPIVFVVDNDVSVHEWLEPSVCCGDWQPETFASVQEFLDYPRVLAPNCLAFDVSLAPRASVPHPQRLRRHNGIFTVVNIHEEAEFTDAVLEALPGVVSEPVLKPGG